MPTNSGVRIETSGLRVEFDGDAGPSSLVVPVIFPVGTHKDISLRIRPRPDVALHNEVDVGDAFRSTFTRSHTTTGGGSFFATASHGRTYGSSEKPYDVVYLEDLHGLRFRLFQLEVPQEPIALQMAFPVRSCGGDSTEDFFAEVALEIGGLESQRVRVPREVHPGAGKVLLVAGFSETTEERMFGSIRRSSLETGIKTFSTASPQPRIAAIRRPYLQISKLHRPDLKDLRSLARGHAGLHLYTNVDRGKIFFNDTYVEAEEIFAILDGLGICFIFLATCNSVQVVRCFRDTDIGAMIAATENLYVNYAEAFELTFYESLGKGDYISNAFNKASTKTIDEGELLLTRSGKYNPMFLDLRKDFRFESSNGR
jgi:hypothetical protein